MMLAKPGKNQRRLSLFRLAVALAAIGCFLHLSHRKYPRMADMTPKGDNSRAFSKSRDSEIFQATAYCLTGITKSGVPAAPGLVAADPNVIPLGSMIYVESALMGGVYQVLDTGGLIKGKIIDIFIPSYDKCIEFGRRIVKVRVLRYGFHNEKPQKPIPKDQ